MTAILDAVALPLFVPADRPDRFGKAFSAGADAVILDLEDAVPPDRQGRGANYTAGGARTRSVRPPAPCWCGSTPPARPGTQTTSRQRLPCRSPGSCCPRPSRPRPLRKLPGGSGRAVLALVESARGIAAAREVAKAAARLAFGSIDFAADLGCAETREALLAFRSELVLASRLAGLPAPIDGVTAALRDPVQIEDDARYASGLGFGGKLLIHPAQIGPARAGFSPTPAEVAWAERVLANGRDGQATAIDGAMVDAPVRMRAEQILRRAAAGRAWRL